MSSGGGATRKELRLFGFGLAFACSVFYGLKILKSGDPSPYTLAIVAGALASLALLLPGWLRPLHALLFPVFHGLGRILTVVLLSFLYFFLFTPFAAIFRLIGRDSLDLRGAGGESCWKDREQAEDTVERFERLS